MLMTCSLLFVQIFSYFSGHKRKWKSKDDKGGVVRTVVVRELGSLLLLQHMI